MNSTPHLPNSIIIMGVTSSGKSTVGKLLAKKLNQTFCDGDAFHSAENIAKMALGEPLTDEDRWPWLEQIGLALREDRNLLIACSALKHSYRSLIGEKAEHTIIFVHLTGSRALLARRMNMRKEHFMPISLLDSQLETLETPREEELSITVNINAPINRIVNRIIMKINALEKTS